MTGDSGGLPSAVTFVVTRQSSGESVLTGTGQATPQTFTLPAGSYLISPSVADAAYTITDTSHLYVAGRQRVRIAPTSSSTALARVAADRRAA